MTGTDTDRRSFLGGAFAAAALPRKASAAQDAAADGPSAFPVLLLVLCGRCDAEAGDVATPRRIVAVDLGSEDEWGDLNVFWDGKARVWGLGNDVDGYWKIERVFACDDSRTELHEGKFPFGTELTREGLALLMERRAMWR